MMNKMVSTALLALVALTASGCGAGGESFSTETVRESPSSTLLPQTGGVNFDARLINPVDGAMAVSAATPIRIRFSHAPDPAAQVTLSDAFGPLSATLACHGADCELLADAPLAADSRYTITVAAGSQALNPDNGLLNTSRTWSFSTGDAGDRASVVPLTPVRVDGGWVPGVRVNPISPINPGSGQGGPLSVSLSSDGVADGPWQVNRATSVFMAPLALSAHAHHTLIADITTDSGPMRPLEMRFSIGWTDATPMALNGLGIDGLNDVAALSRDLLWAVGDAGTILGSDDGGYTWSEQRRGGAPLRALHAITPTDLWAVGDAGTVLHGDGLGWTPVAVPTHVNLRDVLFVGQNRGFIIGGLGTVLRTDDGGATWKNLTTSTGLGLNTITCDTLDSCHLVGDSGTLMVTHDGGDSWVRIGLSTRANLNGIQMLADGSGWIGGEGGILLTGSDADGWAVRGTTGQQSLGGLSFTPDGHGWAVGSGNSVIGTADAGRNWQAMPLPGNASLSAIAHHGNDRLVAVGRDASGAGIILRTDTGGRI